MSLLQIAKRATNRLLEAAHTGHRVDHEAVIPRFGRLADHLDRAGLTPATVIDIGVAEGTPWLYERYPNARYFLVDPTPQSLPHMSRWANILQAQVLNVALGSEDGMIPIRIRPDIGGSSMLTGEGSAAVSEVLHVPMRRFDNVIIGFARPALVKVDVQGAEVMVIDGMGDAIKSLDCIVVETTLISSLDKQPEFAEVVALMRARDFVLYDIVGVLRRPLDHALFSIDAVFVPEGSLLRQDRRWDI